MAYTPINWQTGDTITAEKMNKMDNGWGSESTQLFSESVTTEDAGEGFSSGTLEYAPFIDADTINVLFDSVTYTCPRIDAGGDSAYGGFDDGPDFTIYPFFIYSAVGGSDNSIVTQTEGTHTIEVNTFALQVGDSFKSAVEAAGQGSFAGTDAYGLEIVIGNTTFAEVYEAMQSNMRVYINNSGSNSFTYSIITYASLDNYTVRGITLGGSGSVPSVVEYHASSADGVLS